MTKAVTSSKQASKNAKDLSYEQSLEELERLVASMEAGQLPLDQLLTHYQRGAELLKQCREQLQAVEQQVKLLDGAELRAWEEQ